jgi:hypothetical protein
LGKLLASVKARTAADLKELNARLAKIRAFEDANAELLSGGPAALIQDVAREAA